MLGPKCFCQFTNQSPCGDKCCFPCYFVLVWDQQRTSPLHSMEYLNHWKDRAIQFPCIVSLTCDGGMWFPWKFKPCESALAEIMRGNRARELCRGIITTLTPLWRLTWRATLHHWSLWLEMNEEMKVALKQPLLSIRLPPLGCCRCVCGNLMTTAPSPSAVTVWIHT